MSGRKGGPARILHCHSTFSAGGKERRAVKLMNAFGKRAEHEIVSAMPDQMGAKKLIARSVRVHFPTDFPSLTGKPSPARLSELAKAMRGYDLILTYNWGAMDAVLAHTLFGQLYGLPPLIHHEDGFNQDEARKLKASRNWFRRIALGRASALVVPSELLESIARTAWKQPNWRLARIPNGIDTAAFAKPAGTKALGLEKKPGHQWVGTLAGLRPVKQLHKLVEAFQGMPDNWHLVIFGEGPEEAAIRAASVQFGLEERVHLPGAISDPAKAVGLFDIFALSSQSEQFPLSVVEAMAAGMPVVSFLVGDIASIVAEENAGFIVPSDDTKLLGEALRNLAQDSELRAKIGAANQAKAREQFDEEAMVNSYRALYGKAMGRKF